MINIKVTGPNKSDAAHVTSYGQLVTGPHEYSEAYYVELGVNDQIYNVVPAKTNKRFVITAMVLGADRNVTTDTSVHIYESLSEDGTADKSILRADINKGETLPLTSLNTITQTSRFINATADDDDVDLTIFGYYVQDHG